MFWTKFWTNRHNNGKLVINFLYCENTVLLNECGFRDPNPIKIQYGAQINPAEPLITNPRKAKDETSTTQFRKSAAAAVCPSIRLASWTNSLYLQCNSP